MATANHSEQVQVALYHSWKLIRYPRVNRTQLFDLKKDPFERNDLVGKKKSAERVQELSARLDQALQRYGDKLYSPD